MPNVEDLAAAVNDIARTGMKPKEIIAKVRQRHPKASKKDIVHAAFYALTMDGTVPGDKHAVQDFAIRQRAGGED